MFRLIALLSVCVLMISGCGCANDSNSDGIIGNDNAQEDNVVGDNSANDSNDGLMVGDSDMGANSPTNAPNTRLGNMAERAAGGVGNAIEDVGRGANNVMHDVGRGANNIMNDVGNALR